MDDSLSELSKLRLLQSEFLELKKQCKDYAESLEEQEEMYERLFDELLEFDDKIEDLEVQNTTLKEDRDLMFWVGIATMSAVLFAPDVADLIRLIIAS